MCIRDSRLDRLDPVVALGLDALLAQRQAEQLAVEPVSYTHLDVYKRQLEDRTDYR